MSENRTRFRLDQRRAPIYEALEQFRQMRVVPFDVPGHKRGRGNPELTAFLGQQCVGVDVNSMKPLDNLCHPVSVIRDAEELAADAFGAAHAFLMVGGPTCLSGDVIGDYRFAALLREGDLLCFGDMAIYTTCKNNTFNGMPLPALWLRRDGGALVPLRSFGYDDFKARLGCAR